MLIHFQFKNIKSSLLANHMKLSVFHPQMVKKGNKIQSFSLVLAFQKFSKWKIGSTPAAKIRTLVLLYFARRVTKAKP